MAFITFVAPYKPIMCGIADYTDFLIRESPPGTLDVLSFDLKNYGVPLHKDPPSLTCPVWYGIPSRDDFSASSIREGLRLYEDQVLWFQHEFGIWPDNAKFVDMLRDLNQIKVVSLHSLHFQKSETPYGLRRHEGTFLRLLLPHTDAITVFSDGVYRAVTQAFPEYIDKVYVLRHGSHVYNKVASMTKQDAKARIYEYLVKTSGLDEASNRRLKQQQVLLGMDTIVIGGTGFISASKDIELIYQARDILQKMLPEAEIVALYVGYLREPDRGSDSRCAMELRNKCNGTRKFFVESYLPEDMLPVMLRALDIHLYWPSDCTQSGILAHALGAGATLACRDLEGVGETVRMAGGLTSLDFGRLLNGVKALTGSAALREELSASAVRYAKEYSWRNQVRRHFELADKLVARRVRYTDIDMPAVSHPHREIRILKQARSAEDTAVVFTDLRLNSKGTYKQI